MEHNETLPTRVPDASEREDSQHQDATSHAEMVMITAIIQPFKLDVVTLALERIPGFGGMTISECRGFGHGKVRSEDDPLSDRDTDVGTRQRHNMDSGLTDFTQKTKLEIAVAGRLRADAVVTAISQAAHTGRPGDGKIFIWPVTGAMRIRTLDLDAGAL